MDILYIVIPAYNEAENIRELIEEWIPVIKKHNGGGWSRLVIVDDGSKDETAAIVRELTDTYLELQLVSKQNGGHGSAVLAGYRHALASGADYIFQTDSDRQTLPSEFEGFWRQRQRFDAVIGRRYARQDGLSRVAVTKTLKYTLLAVFHTYVPDANTPYRLMRADVLRKAIGFLEPDENLPNVMLSVIFAKQKRKVLYRDITFRPRQGGTNSLNVPKIVKLGREAVARMVRLNRKLR